MKKILIFITVCLAGNVAFAQEEADNFLDYMRQRRAAKKMNSEQTTQSSANDSNSPLHLLSPDYPIPYGIPSVDSVMAVTDRVLDYIDRVTPMALETPTHKELSSFNQIDSTTRLRKGDYRLTSYEWGVTYAAVLRMEEVLKDGRYGKYAKERMSFLANAVPYFKKIYQRGASIDPQMRQVIAPKALDDAGAICTAMIKANDAQLKPLIDNYISYITKDEMRLPDGIFARNRPKKESVWLDDMFMGIPAIAQMGRSTGKQYYDEAANILMAFVKRMYLSDKQLFRHGWIESAQMHPSFCWSRANGWAILTMCEVLDVLPDNHPSKAKILEIYRAHVAGIASLQSGVGAWHQLIDRNDTYLETSATAIFTSCIAHGINKGWLDASMYAPVVMLGWNYITTQVTPQGQVAGTCVGTGMGFDPAFYYYRPTNLYAAHGYGPVIWAGAEVIELLKNQNLRMNDSAVHSYETKQEGSAPIFQEK